MRDHLLDGQSRHRDGPWVGAESSLLAPPRQGAPIYLPHVCAHHPDYSILLMCENTPFLSSPQSARVWPTLGLSFLTQVRDEVPVSWPVGGMRPHGGAPGTPGTGSPCQRSRVHAGVRRLAVLQSLQVRGTIPGVREPLCGRWPAADAGWLGVRSHVVLNVCFLSSLHASTVRVFKHACPLLDLQCQRSLNSVHVSEL